MMWGTERTRYLKTDQNYSAIRLTCLCSWNTWLIIKNQNIRKDITGLIHTSQPLHRGEIRSSAYVLLRIAEEIIIYRLICDMVRLHFQGFRSLSSANSKGGQWKILIPSVKTVQDSHFYPSAKSWLSETFKEKQPNKHYEAIQKTCWQVTAEIFLVCWSFWGLSSLCKP